MRVGSLFSGIGGFDLGLEKAGFEISYQIEIDDFCKRVLKKHWPNVKRFSNIRDVRTEDLLKTEVICGGFPCQEISQAGGRKGIEGEKSSLWYEYLRIVQQMRPRWVLIENVIGLRNNGGDEVQAGLEEAGYKAWPLVVGARHIGAPHRRDRVWILAYTDDSGCRERWWRLPEKEELPTPQCAGNVADPNGWGLGSEWFSEILHEQWASQWDNINRCYRWPATYGQRQFEWEEARTIKPQMGEPVDGVSRGVARLRRPGLRALGNSCVPQIAFHVGRTIIRYEEFRQKEKAFILSNH